MPSTTSGQLRAVRRHDAILRAALGLMIGEGMSAVTHRQVAQAADVPWSSIRYYFTTREDLLRACMQQDMSERDTEAQRVLEQAHPGLTAKETARLFLRAFYGADLSDRRLLGIVGMVVDCARATPELSSLLQEQRVVIERDFSALLAKCGRAHVSVSLAAAVIDGSLLNAAALRHDNLADIATNELAALLN
ncbi:TetR/AcrR family transcriptional regulator [Citricoccus alkalitolerans]|uniref:TetR/AcrR family transcriptional regulator n=1 Tax=Citricoccus alkalitolerans TaxID=246603 RepID=A0ABV8XV32_9MICC